MSVYSAIINLDETNPRNLLQIFEQDPTRPYAGGMPILVEHVCVELESDDTISLQPYGFQAVAWTSHRNEDGRHTRSTTCRKIR